MAASTERRSSPSASRAWWPVTTASKPERQRPVEHGGELDLLVAAQARVRRPAGRVLGHEVVDDVLAEPVGEVPDVERDAELVGDPAGVVRVLDAAAARARRCAGSAGPATAPGARRSRRARRRPRARRRRRSPLPRSSRRAPSSPAHPRAAGALDHRADHLEHRVDVGVGRGVAEAEPQRAAGAVGVGADRPAGRGWAARRRRCTPSRWSTRCRGRRAA